MHCHLTHCYPVASSLSYFALSSSAFVIVILYIVIFIIILNHQDHHHHHHPRQDCDDDHGRDIPAAALANLESLASTDFKANLGRIIHDIYQVIILIIIILIPKVIIIIIIIINIITTYSDGAHDVRGHATGRPQEARQVQVKTLLSSLSSHLHLRHYLTQIRNHDQSQVCLQDSDEDPAFCSEDRG